MAALLAEIEGCGEGDSIELHVYLVEPGSTSERAFAALRAAAERGVQVTFSIDWTLTSHVQRWWEWTPTYLPAALALARELPERITAEQRSQADHSKYALFRRPGGTDSALLGGINLGDRFRGWRDFMIRLRDPAHVAALRRALSGEAATPAVPPPPGSVSFAANVPQREQLGIEATFHALLTCEDYPRYLVAMAYVDTHGTRVLERALRRGAELELILPREANVYHDANLRALNRLRRLGGSLRAYLAPEMVHAKALVAYDAAGAPLAFVGSANLKRASLTRLGELNALISAPELAEGLELVLRELRDSSLEVEQEQVYFWLKAVIEEFLG